MPEVFILSITLLSLVYFLTLQILENALNKIRIPDNKNISGKNKVSVIVCARNEEKNLPELFRHLEQQDIVTHDVEFIIVNDRSEDKTAELIEKQTSKNKHFKAIHINDRLPGFAPKKRAIDEAIRQAKGDLLLFTDADGRPKPAWLETMCRLFDAGADMIIGYAPYTATNQSSIIRKVLSLEYFSIALIAASSTALKYPITCIGTNFAYRKKVYQDVGGFGRFKSFISGDDDLFLTIVRDTHAYDIQFAADEQSHVFNDPPKSFSQFVNQRLRFASKGFNYPLKVTLGLTFYVIFNLLIPFGLVLGFIGYTEILMTTLAVILLKTIFEYKYVRKAANILSETRFTNYYFLTALMHLPYVLFFGIFGQLKLFKWAESKVEHGIIKNGVNSDG